MGARLTVGGGMGHLNRLAIERRQLDEVAVGDDTCLRPATRRRHVHLTLQQCLADIDVSVELAGMKHLGSNLAVGRGFELFEKARYSYSN